MTAQLTFDAATHSYYHAGMRVPGVTEVLRGVGFADYAGVPHAAREAALARGKAVHEAIALDIARDLDESSIDGSEIAGYLSAARSALAALPAIEPRAVERMVYHSALYYAGTIDLVIGDQIIVDWKTNSVEYWTRFQLAAYAAALSAWAGASTSGFRPIRRIAVELHADGTYRIYEVPLASFQEDFQTFLAALRIFREKQHRRMI